MERSLDAVRLQMGRTAFEWGKLHGGKDKERNEFESTSTHSRSFGGLPPAGSVRGLDRLQVVTLKPL